MEKKPLNLYKISFSEDFFDSLSDGIVNKISPSCKVKDFTIILPTKKACIELENRFQNYEEKPKIISISNLNEKFLNIKLDANYGSRFALLKRINKILSSFLTDNLNLTLELSEYLFQLLTLIQSHNISYEQIIPLLTQENDLYKQKISKILINFFEKWKEENILTPAGYNNFLIQNLNKENLIIAGINSTLPSILELYKRTIKNQNSYVILYGIDDYLTKENWQNIAANNAQYNNAHICKYLQINPNEIAPWNNNNRAHSEFASLALRSAHECNNWHELTNLDSKNIEYYLSSDQYDEARTIVNLVKNYSQEKILIVTPDENLTINIKLSLEFANLDFNIIRDFPLKSSLVGRWLELCLNYLANRQSLINLITLLKHPFSFAPEEELLTLEETLRTSNIKDIFLLSSDFSFLAELFKYLDDFLKIGSFSSLNDFLNQHLLFAQNISKIALWETEEALELKKYFEQIISEYEYFQPININGYVSLYYFFINSAFYRPEFSQQKKITLSKPIDARLFKSDLIILAGLNKDIWPAKIENEMILKKLGINIGDKYISESAHDFQSFLNSEKIILTSSEKIAGSNASPSPWIQRILTLARIIAKKDQISVRRIEEEFQNRPINFANPPVEARPQRLSVTQFEKLVFNPYHIYVDTILRLKKYPKLIKEAAALDFGNFIHKAIEIKFDHPEYSFSEAGQRALSLFNLDQPQIRILWWPRFLRIASWYENNFKHSNGVYLESKGYLNLANSFILTAKADRLEIEQNQVNIIDFKTGILPTLKSIANGKSLQLLLEAIIAENSGFNCQNKKLKYKVESLKYIQLTGGEESAKILSLKFDQELFNKANSYLNDIISSYQNPNIPYYYTKKKLLSYCHYAHLARDLNLA